MGFSDYIGNPRPVADLRRMMVEDRLPQTLLFAGPLGVGKATLARFLAAAVNCAEADARADFCETCASCKRILATDLSLPEFQARFDERVKLPAAKRGEAPLIVSTHPDFLIFPPDGPLRMISIEQARQLRNAARFNPSEGRRRIFHIDHADRAGDEAANSLLKTLEEPAPSLTIILTAENPYELLPTIRSRCVPFYFSPLERAEMERFFDSRPEFGKADRERLGPWSQGSPGRALGLDPDEYQNRRRVMTTLIETALDAGGFPDLLAETEKVARRPKERLEDLAETMYFLLSDLLRLRHGVGELINADIEADLRRLAERASFEWFEHAARGLDEIEIYRRRNIQKQIALEALALNLRARARTSRRNAAVG